MPLPNRRYFSLCSLALRWGVSDDDVRYFAEHDELSVCCWMDMREIMRYQPLKEHGSILCEYSHFEGYVGLKSSDCRKIFRRGHYKLTNFIDLNDYDFEIAITPQSKDILVSKNDIVICKNERDRFEKYNELNISENNFVPCKASMIGRIDINSNNFNLSDSTKLVLNPSKQEFYFKGRLMQFGPIQSNIIEQLALAHSTESPWMHGKTLLHKAGSQAVRMIDIFKTQPLWREIIQSNKRGLYRIFENIEVKIV